MNCENSTAPIDINNNPTGTCDLKCKFNYLGYLFRIRY